MRVGLLIGNPKIYFEGKPHNYPDFVHESPIIDYLTKTYDTYILTTSSTTHKIRELDSFKIPYKYGSLDDIDVIFSAQFMCSDKEEDNIKKIADEIVRRRIPVLYRDSDEETYNHLLGQTNGKRVSLMRSLIEMNYDLLTIISTSIRPTTIENKLKVHYLPVVYSSDVSTRVKSMIAPSEKKYFSTFIGTMIGRRYLSEWISYTRSEDDPPSNIAVPSTREIEMFTSLNIPMVKENIRVNDHDLMNMINSINSSKFHFHGASWYSNTVRSQIDKDQNPPYAVLKLVEVTMTHDTVPLTLRVPELSDIFPEELVWDKTDLSSRKAPTHSKTLYDAAIRGLGNLEIGCYTSMIDSLLRG